MASLHRLGQISHWKIGELGLFLVVLENNDICLARRYIRYHV